ncbi:UNVERIFIED_CONTAM: hypothetical protein K2H54_040202 [Gekko kuhli]
MAFSTSSEYAKWRRGEIECWILMEIHYMKKWACVSYPAIVSWKQQVIRGLLREQHASVKGEAKGRSHSDTQHISKRSSSLGRLYSHSKYSIQVPRSVKYYRSPSLPNLLDFETFAQNKGGIPERLDDFAWVREIWNKWFDDEYSPSNESAENNAASAKKTAEEKYKEEEKELTDSALIMEDETSQFDELQSEIDRLTKQIKGGCALAFNYCRRGALYRKMGKLKTAMDDLEKVHLKQILMLPLIFFHFL